jgi:hypothetical protein
MEQKTLIYKSTEILGSSLCIQNNTIYDTSENNRTLGTKNSVHVTYALCGILIFKFYGVKTGKTSTP